MWKEGWRGETKTHQLDKDTPDNIYFKLSRVSLVSKVVEKQIWLHELWPQKRKRLSVRVFFGRDAAAAVMAQRWGLWVQISVRIQIQTHTFCLLAIFGSNVTGWKSQFAVCYYLHILHFFFCCCFSGKKICLLLFVSFDVTLLMVTGAKVCTGSILSPLLGNIRVQYEIIVNSSNKLALNIAPHRYLNVFSFS